MDRIFDEIRRERDRQDERYDGPDHDDNHYSGDWCLILTKYLGRAAAETIDGGDDATFRESMIKIVAVAVAATESFDRIQGEERKRFRGIDHGEDTTTGRQERQGQGNQAHQRRALGRHL